MLKMPKWCMLRIVDKSDVNCMIFRICSSKNVFIDEVTTFFYFLG